tara:strand:- start:2094 stop:3230 length:1137 start_codon:yes stop_codon:yes gene_type:complete
MAVSGKVYSKNDFSLGIVAKNGSAFSTQGAADGAYKLLPVINASSPVLNLVESGEIRSNNAGMIEFDKDQFRTRQGGFVTLDFEVPAERNFITRMIANVLQDHTENTGGTNVIHTVEASSSNAMARPNFTASSSAGVPSLFDIGLYYPGSGEDKIITSAVLQSLTMNFDMADGRCLLSGSFYSGFTSADTFRVEQTLSANSGAPDVIAASGSQAIPVESNFDVKKLDVDGQTLTDIVITAVSFTFENNIARVGRDTNGNAEGYAFGIPSVNITGELSILYDGNVNFAATKNILQDFLDGNTATLQLQQGDGTVDAAELGEMNITAEIFSTAVNLDANADAGAVITIPFKVVQPTDVNGDPNGTAFKFEYNDKYASSTW